MVIKIGIDFDNTIVNYEDSFYQEAIKRKIFTKSQRKKNSKNVLKNRLISIKKELKAIGIATWVLVNPCSELSDEVQQQKRRTDFEVIKL